MASSRHSFIQARDEDISFSIFRRALIIEPAMDDYRRQPNTSRKPIAASKKVSFATAFTLFPL